MPPRSASQSGASRCCHAVRNQLATTTTTITRSASSSPTTPPASSPTPSPVWISDNLLAHAFARFSRVSHAGRAAASRRAVHVRLSSSVPGPLEARRRLGKRQMTEQLARVQYQPLPPLPYPFLSGSAGSGSGSGGSSSSSGWATMASPSSSAYSLDPRLWQWSPPRDPTAFLLSEATEAVAADSPATDQQPVTRSLPWLSRVGEALGELSSAPSEETPSKAPSPSPSPLPPPSPSPQPSPSPSRSQDPASLRSATAQPFFTELYAWRRSTATTVTAATFAQNLETICRALEIQLQLAGLTADEAEEAFDVIWAGLQSASASPSSFLFTQALVLYTAVLRGLDSCRLLPAATAAVDLGAPFWRRLLESVCTLSAAAGDKDNTDLARIAADTLAATPPAFVAQDLSDLVPAVLEAVFCTDTVDETRTNAVAAALRDVVESNADGNSKNRDDIVTATTSRLLQRWAQQQGGKTTASTDYVPAGLQAWLRTLAHMPQVRQDRLFAVLAQTQEHVQAVQPTAAPPAENATPLFCDAFLSELLLAQWASRGYIPLQEMLQSYRQITQESYAAVHAGSAPSVELAALALAVYRTPPCRPRCVALYVSLLTCLHRLGRGNAALVSSVEALMGTAVQRQEAVATAVTAGRSPRLSPLPLPFLESLAWAADDLPTALKLHALYALHARHNARISRTDPRLRFLRAMDDIVDKNENGDGNASTATTKRRRRSNEWPLWRLAFWNKFADRLGEALDRGTLTPGQVSFALDLGERGGNKPRKSAAPNSKAKSLGEPTAALLEQLAMHYALAPELVPRRALRGVEQCRAVLVQHRCDRKVPAVAPTTALTEVSEESASQSSASPSLTILRALFHLITRDLAEAQPGRTSRLRWFVALVQREHSAAAAKASGRALERWRTVAARVDQTKMDSWEKSREKELQKQRKD